MLSEEQKAEIKKIRKSFYTKVVLISFLYLLGMLLGDFSLIVLNALTVKSSEFLFFTSFGTGIIAGLGLQKHLEELHKNATDKIVNVLGS